MSDTVDRVRPGKILIDRHTSTPGPLDIAMAEATRVGRHAQIPLSAPLPKVRNQTLTL